MFALALLLIRVTAQNKVSLGIYFESCSFKSQNYIVNSLSRAWNKQGFPDVVDVLLVPWGFQTYKSTLTGHYSYQCQHGPNECIIQKIESCAAMYISRSRFVTFVIELQKKAYNNCHQNCTNCFDAITISKTIAEKLNISWHQIGNCINTVDVADQAEMLSYIKTMQLDPPLTKVPWITLQGNHTNNCVDNTLKCVCQVYNSSSSVCKHKKYEVNGLIKMHPRMNLTDIVVFTFLMCVSLLLWLVSMLSIAREKYAIEVKIQIKRVRSILFLTTFLQLICFTGYWLGIYLMYELCWIIWLTLSTLSILMLGIQFGESYIQLISAGSYSKKSTAVLKCLPYLYLFWFVGCCIDATGTVFGILYSNQLAQAICYSIWEVLCSISISCLIWILCRYKKNLKGTRRIDEKKQEYSAIKSVKSYGSLKTGDESVIENKESSISTEPVYVSHHKTDIHETGSINSNLLLRRGNKMESEIKRIRHLVIGLIISIIALMVNAGYNGHYAIAVHDYTHHNKSVYMHISTVHIAVIFFSEWTVINLFIMKFSWIPKYQLKHDCSYSKICKNLATKCKEKFIWNNDS